MLLLLRSTATADDLEALRALARDLGYEPKLLDQKGRVLELRRLEASGGTDSAHHRSRFEDQAAVQSVLDNEEAPEKFERGHRPADTTVSAGDARFGGGSFSIIAGPCAVESPERLFEVAESVRSAGAALLRAGAYKPRTSPYSFQGLGEKGLELLARVRDETGLGIVTEVLDPRCVERVAQTADMLQVGSRSMGNSALLSEVGKSGMPVLLKRGMAATVREFLLAAEYVLNEGNPHVVLCERGIRGFDSVTRNLLDLGAVAYLKQQTHLPVVVDPSHAAGRADLVVPLAKAGVVAGGDGLVVEVHPHPSEVRSDGAQAISPDTFHDLARAARALVELERKTFVAPPLPFTPKTSVMESHP